MSGYETTRFFEQDESWKVRAACRDSDTRLFFPERGDPVHEAKAICADCVSVPSVLSTLWPSRTA